MIVCTICARAGSKGLPGKNLRELAGQPLICHTIEFALKTEKFTHVVVTSDSREILDIARSYEAVTCVVRPGELAGDVISKLPAIQHALGVLEITEKPPAVVVDLDPTAPLRELEDLDGVLKLLDSNGCTNVVTGCVARRNPYFNLVEVDGLGRVQPSKSLAVPVTSRQTAPKCFDMNSSIYAWHLNELLGSTHLFGAGTRLYEMPEERSRDIDSEFDFQLVEYLLTKRPPIWRLS